MKVNNLKAGNLYKIRYPVHGHFDYIGPDHWAISGNLNSQICVMRLHKWGTFNVNNSNIFNCSEYIIYLGAEVDRWRLHGIKKHHYFLYDGKRIIIDNYCMKMLEEVKDGSL